MPEPPMPDMPPMVPDAGSDAMPPMDQNMNAPQGGDEMPPMGPDAGAPQDENGIESKISQLSPEDEKAAENYIDSLLKKANDEGDEEAQEPNTMPQGPDAQQPAPQMPESRRSVKDTITEIINNILNDEDSKENRDDKKIRNKKVKRTNPFVSKY